MFEDLANKDLIQLRVFDQEKQKNLLKVYDYINEKVSEETN